MLKKQGAIEKIHQQLINAFGPIENLSILDYGCGAGGLTKALLNQEKIPASIYAVDIDPSMIEKTSTLCTPQIDKGMVKTAIIADPKQLNKQSFDGIFCHNVLELVEQKEQFLSDLCDLLKEDGTCILSHMDFDSMIYNSSFKELTRKLIHHFSDTKQAWMNSNDGQIGRKIPGIIRRANLQNVAFKTLRWTETSFQANDYGFLMVNALIEVASDSFDKNELLLWKSDLEEKARSNDYFFAIDIDIAKIKR